MTAADIYDRYHLRVFRFLRRMTGSDRDAEDLTQDVFLRVARSSGTYRPENRDEAWVFAIARNLLTNHHRDGARRPDMSPLVDRAHAASSIEPGAELQEALGALADADREAFLLREVGGLGYAEIASVTGSTPDAARSRIHRARMSLRKALSPPQRRESP